MLSVSGRMSAKPGRAPRSTKALTVETNVNDGTITSSPGLISSSSAAISSAWVQDVVSSALGVPIRRSRSAWHFFVNVWSPAICPISIACAMYCISRPINDERLNGMRTAAAGLDEESLIPLVVIPLDGPGYKPTLLIQSLGRDVTSLGDDRHPQRPLSYAPVEGGFHKLAAKAPP